MLIVTIAALVMAAGLGWFAYRLLQEEQRRSDARVALLTSALEADPMPAPATIAAAPLATPHVSAAVATPTPRPVVAAAPAVPAVPSIVMLDDDSRDMRRFASEHRAVAATTPAPLTAMPPEVVSTPVPTPAATSPVTLGSRAPFTHEEPAADADTRVGSSLFADVPEARPADARGLMAVAALVLVGLLGVGYAWFGSGAASPTPTATAATTTATEAATPGGLPVELVALTHERRGETLVVRGVVRNPIAGSTRAGLVASVLLLDEAGGFLRSGRAPLPGAALAPGADASFSVDLPAHDAMRRYRVTFRAADGGLVPHADQRTAPTVQARRSDAR